jgi:hypothetical protein
MYSSDKGEYVGFRRDLRRLNTPGEEDINYNVKDMPLTTDGTTLYKKRCAIGALSGEFSVLIEFIYKFVFFSLRYTRQRKRRRRRGRFLTFF